MPTDRVVTPRRVLLVGAGAVSRFHLDALERLGVDVVAAVDPALPDVRAATGAAVPVSARIEDALAGRPCDTAIVATPTPSHVEVCDELLRLPSPVEILVEKPLATRLADVDGLQRRASDRGRALRTLYHAAYGDEVLWAAEHHAETVDRHGPVVSLEAWHSDPYAHRPDRARSLVSSWLDSGINALSVLHRFVDLLSVDGLERRDDLCSTYQAEVAFRSRGARGTGSVITTWHVTLPTKHTRLRHEDGTELILDHTAVAARLVRGARVLAVFATDGSVPRLTGHYVNLLAAHLGPGPNDWTADDDALLHGLLLRPPEASTVSPWPAHDAGS